jgi:hypothetical protein
MLLLHYLVWLTLQDSTRDTSEYISTFFWRRSNPVHDMKLNMLTILVPNLNVFVLQFE